MPEDVRTDWLDLTTPVLPPFRDLRGEGSPPPEGRLAEIAQLMKPASDIVLVAPVYWYALPAPAKLLLDHWSGWLDAPGYDFGIWIREKRMWLITCRADPDPSVVEGPEGMVRKSAEWLGMEWGGALHGVGDAPGDVDGDLQCRETAPTFFAGLRPKRA
jgi:hypothetical protein